MSRVLFTISKWCSPLLSEILLAVTGHFEWCYWENWAWCHHRNRSWGCDIHCYIRSICYLQTDIIILIKMKLVFESQIRSIFGIRKKGKNRIGIQFTKGATLCSACCPQHGCNLSIIILFIYFDTHLTVNFVIHYTSRLCHRWKWKSKPSKDHTDVADYLFFLFFKIKPEIIIIKSKSLFGAVVI